MSHPKLRILSGRAAGETFHLTDETMLGRDPSNHVQLRDASASRHHARIELRDTHALLKDLGSNNGTFVNGARIEQEKLLESGDRIRIGRVTLLFEWHEPVPDPGGSTASLDPGLTTPLKLNSKITDTDASNFLRAVRAETEVLQPEQAFQRLKRLYEISQQLAGELEPAKLTRRLLETTLTDLGADVAALLFFRHPGSEEIVVRTAKKDSGGPPRVARSLLEQAMSERTALRFDGRADPSEASRSVIEQKIVSAVVAPVLAGKTVMGALYADRRGKRLAFNKVDLEFLSILTAQSATLLVNALRFERTVAHARHLESVIPGFGPIIGKSPPFIEVLEVAQKAALSDASVLLTGETGTGKEIVARMIHRQSARRDGPFIALNCAALVETLLESELFGHERGAFTGAIKTKQGCFEMADSGTLFLDEIGEMSPSVQAKLLRAIQERSFYRVGGSSPVKVDVRIVSATNIELKKAVEKRDFREDLYFRLGVIVARLPALRERPDDIPLLAYHFLERFAHQLKKPIRSIKADAMKLLESYRWPGNIRELQNVIERAIVLTDAPEISVALLPMELRGVVTEAPAALPVNIKEAEKLCIERALKMTGGKKGKAAKLLGISWPTLNKKITDYQIKT